MAQAESILPATPEGSNERYKRRLYEGDVAFTDLASAVRAVHDIWFEAGLSEDLGRFRQLCGFNYALCRVEDELQRVSDTLWPNGKL